MAKSSLLRRSDLAGFGINEVPARGGTLETVLLGQRVRIEHTDLHRPSGARLYRVIPLGPPGVDSPDGAKNG